MDTYESRRANLQMLIDREFGGNQAALATVLGLKPPQVNRWLSSTAKDTRKITEESARRIERACGKEDGWLDFADLTEVDQAPAQDPAREAENNPELRVVLRAWQLATELDRAVVVSWARAVLSGRR